MATISFVGVTDVVGIQRTFEYIRDAKDRGGVIEDELREILGELCKTKFLDLSTVELSDPSSLPKGLWDFGSWVDALNNSDLTYTRIETEESAGKLMFEQNSSPSGGIEATEEIVRIHGGQVVANDAV